jgi:predicted acylesterase/phospholipase RssA
MRRWIVRTTCAFVLLQSVTACAAISRPQADLASIQADGDRARVEHAVTRDSVLDRLVRRAQTRPDRTLDILMLSGGGQHGAFGVGFMRGWASRSTDAMPQFDLVSAISTGALQAPFALLGTPAALDTITALYRSAADRIAPTFDWWFWLRRTGGIVNTTRYERSIASVVNESMQSSLQTEFSKSRQLLIATTDMDLGIGRIWDMSVALNEPEAPLDRARLLLYTATAIPGVFPPRVIDGHVHSDGGVISNVLPLLSLEDYRELATRLRAAGVQGDVNVRVWVIMNVFTHAPVRMLKPSSRGKISGRTNELLFWAAQPHQLERLQELGRAVSSDVPGLRMQVRIAQPHASLIDEPGAQKLFDKPWMLRLEQIGYEQSRSASPWDSITSSYERPPARR